MNKQAENDNEVNTKAFVDQFHRENVESRDLVKNYQYNDLKDDKLTNLDSLKVNRDPASDNELANKKYVDDSIDNGTILRFNQTLEYYLKVSIGKDTYNLTKYNEI